MAAVPVIPGVIDSSTLPPIDPLGSASSISRDTTVCCRTFCVSTIGDCPDTVIVSSSAPTCMATLTAAVKPAVSRMPSRLEVLKPDSEKVTA